MVQVLILPISSSSLRINSYFTWALLSKSLFLSPPKLIPRKRMCLMPRASVESHVACGNGLFNSKLQLG